MITSERSERVRASGASEFGERSERVRVGAPEGGGRAQRGATTLQARKNKLWLCLLILD